MSRITKSIFLVGVVLLIATQIAYAAGPFQLSGTYQTETQSGTISFTPTRGIFPGWYKGHVMLDGSRIRNPAIFHGYNDGSGRVDVNWYFNSQFTQLAGSVVTYLQPDGSLSGTITFYDTAGNITGTGTVVLYFV